ncbi:MAG: hypothetical protein ACR2MG_13975 [Pyrinomonadaceae bacterium]
MKSKLFPTVLLTTLIWLSVSACASDAKIKEGNEVAVKIENFRSEKGRLPNSLTEVGIAEMESGPIYYDKKSESKYILWFGKELGESVVYDSDTKQWK